MWGCSNMDKMPIRIISPQFELLGEIDDYESLQFIRRFYKVGEFELHVNINKNNTDKLQKNNLILLGNQFHKVGIIMHIETQDDENGLTTLIVRGSSLKGIMSRRLIVPPTGSNGYDNQSGNIETILKNFVNNHVVSPTDINRKIPQVSIATNQQRGNQDAWRGRFEVLSDKLAEISEYTQLGWDVILDITNQSWVFDVMAGRTLTVNQNILPPVIFSTDFDNIKGKHFIQSILNSFNVGYAGGAGDETNRLIQQIGNITGMERTEVFLDCSQASDVTELITQGNQKLGEFKEVLTFEFSIIPDNTFIYEQNYDLGDYITAQDKKLGVVLDAQIIELVEIYESSAFSLEGTFGANIPTLVDKINRASKRVPLIESSSSSGITNIDGGSFK